MLVLLHGRFEFHSQRAAALTIGAESPTAPEAVDLLSAFLPWRHSLVFSGLRRNGQSKASATNAQPNPYPGCVQRCLTNGAIRGGRHLGDWRTPRRTMAALACQKRENPPIPQRFENQRFTASPAIYRLTRHRSSVLALRRHDVKRAAPDCANCGSISSASRNDKCRRCGAEKASVLAHVRLLSTTHSGIIVTSFRP